MRFLILPIFLFFLAWPSEGNAFCIFGFGNTCEEEAPPAEQPQTAPAVDSAKVAEAKAWCEKSPENSSKCAEISGDKRLYADYPDRVYKNFTTQILAAKAAAAEEEEERKRQAAREAKRMPLYSKGYDSLFTKNQVSEIAEKKAVQKDGVVGIRNILQGQIIKISGGIIIAVATIWLIILGISFVVSQGNEETISKNKRQFGWILAGLLAISIAEFLAFNVFDPAGEVNLLVEKSDAQNSFINLAQKIKQYAEYLIIGIMLIVLGMTGYNILTNPEENEVLEQEKRFVKTFFLGAFLILMAEVIVRALSIGEGSTFDAEASTNIALREFIGLINFLLSFVAGAATFMLIFASIYYVTSFGNEDQTGRAKKIIIASLVAVVVSYSSYVLSSFMFQIMPNEKSLSEQYRNANPGAADDSWDLKF